MVTRNQIESLQRRLRFIADQISNSHPAGTDYSEHLEKYGYGWFSNSADAMSWVLDLPAYGGDGSKERAHQEMMAKTKEGERHV